MEIISLVCDLAVQPSKVLMSFLLFVRPQMLARKPTIRRRNSILLFLVERRSFHIILRVFCYEHLPLEPEVEADAFTRACLHLGFGQFTDEEDVDVSQGIPLDRNGLGLSLDMSAVRIAVSLLAEDDLAVLLVELPSILFERDGLVLLDFTEFRRCGLFLVFKVSSKQFVAFVDAFRRIDLAVKFLVSLGLEQLELVCLHHADAPPPLFKYIILEINGGVSSND